MGPVVSGGEERLFRSSGLSRKEPDRKSCTGMDDPSDMEGRVILGPILATGPYSASMPSGTTGEER